MHDESALSSVHVESRGSFILCGTCGSYMNAVSGLMSSATIIGGTSCWYEDDVFHIRLSKTHVRTYYRCGMGHVGHESTYGPDE